MIYEHDKELRFALLINNVLKVVLAIIIILLWVFLVKAKPKFIPAPASRNVFDIIYYYLLIFFNTFGELTSKYMLQASIFLFINTVVLAANKVLKIFKTRMFNLALFLATLILVFNLPMDKLYLNFIKDGKFSFMIFCFIMLLAGPLVMGISLAKDRIGTFVVSKLFYVIIWGLLLAQLILEQTVR